MKTKGLNQVTVGSMFAGIGGICLGFKNVGAKIVWANEFDAKACQVYYANFGDSYLIKGDIRELPAAHFRKNQFDILTAGFPCQPFSIAGHQGGFTDERGYLFYEIERVLNLVRPQAFLLENVKNLVTIDQGRTFAIILDALAAAGYFVSYQVLNAMEYGNIPQSRERVYIVGFQEKRHYRHYSFPEAIPLTQNLANVIHFDEKKEARYYYDASRYADLLKRSVCSQDSVYQLRRVYVRENKRHVCPTLTANMGSGGHNVPIIRDHHGIRKLTPKECLLFQGFPTDFLIPEDLRDATIYKQAGNSVAVPVIERIACRMLAALAQ